MKKFIVFCLFLMAACSVYGFDLRASMDYETMYVFRGQRVIDSPCLNPDVALVGNNFELQLKSFYNMDKNESFKGEYSIMFKTDAKKFDMRVGFLHHDMWKNVDRDSTEFVVSAAWEGRFRPFMNVYFDMKKGSGKYIQAGIEHQLLEGKDKLALGLNFGYMINNGLMMAPNADGNFSGFYNGEIRLHSVIDMGKDLKAYPFVAYSFPLSQAGKFAIKQLSMDNESNSFYGGVKMEFLF